MHFDALTLACVRHELQHTLAGGRIQQVVLPDEQSIGLEVYAQHTRHNLLIVAASGQGRIHRVDVKLRRGVEKETPLLLLLRKYIRNSTLTAIEQPDPTERVIQLTCEHAAQGVTTLVVEPMGRLSNIFLLNPQGRILECIHRVPPGEHAARVLLPGRDYTPPPPQERIPPWDDGREEYYARMQRLLMEQGPLWKALVGGVAGVSPSLAREAAWRATGDAQTPAQDAELPAVLQALQELWAPARSPESAGWEPGIWQTEAGITGFSAYAMHFAPGYTPMDSISQALAAYYAAPRTPHQEPDAAEAAQDGYAGMRKQVAQQLAQARRRVEGRLAALDKDEPDVEAAAALRTKAEWLLAMQHQVEPGQKMLSVDTGADEPLEIALDPTFGPVQQAQRMFKRAGKLERAADFIPRRRAELEADLAFVEELETELALAENQPEIAAVEEELARSRLLPPRPKRSRPRQAKPELLRVLSPSGWEIVVGRNARQNDHVTFQIANAADLWLHVRDAPGAHVIVRSGGQEVDEETLTLAAQLAAYYSKRRGERAAPVAVTTQRMVTRVPRGRPGQVHMRNEETVVVPADLPEEGLNLRDTRRARTQAKT